MLQECIDVFKSQLQEQDGETLILDQYVPKDGSYYLITRKADHTFELDEPLEISYDKKKKEIIGLMDERYEFIKFLDYNSKLLEMNKPIDPKKQIHSNNYLSFFVKKDALKDGKVTKEIIEGYYKILEDPTLKYKKGNARKIFDKTVELIGELDREILLEIKEWVLNFDLSELQYSDKKDYLKLFFILEDKNATKQLYEKEGKRYLLPNIFNSNDFNVEVDGEIWGLPNDNLNMNGKKPFLGHLSRNEKVPCLISQEEALIRSQFFDYLMGLASIGKCNVYIDFEENKITGYRSGEFPDIIKNGCFLRIQKGKEVEIHKVEQVVNFNRNLKEPFVYKKYFGLKKDEEPNIKYEYTIDKIEEKIHFIFFDGKLSYNYFTKFKDINVKDFILKQSILEARDRLFLYLYTNQQVSMIGLMKPVMLRLIKHTFLQSLIDTRKKEKLQEQINLYWALLNYWEIKEVNNMTSVRESVRQKINDKSDDKQDWKFEENEECYYAAGQAIGYLISKSKAKSIPASQVNTFLNVKTGRQLAEKISRLYKKYNYRIESGLRGNQRFQRAFSKVQQALVNCDTVDIVWLLSGFADSNLFYEKVEDENGEGGKENDE